MKVLKTMTVDDLRTILADFPGDTKVAFAYPSGDYWRTTLVGRIKSVEDGVATYSAYHQAFKLEDDPTVPVGDELAHDDTDPAGERIVVLGS